MKTDTWGNILLNCPKCGGEPEDINHGHTVVCVDCGYSLGLHEWSMISKRKAYEGRTYICLKCYYSGTKATFTKVKQNNREIRNDMSYSHVCAVCPIHGKMLDNAIGHTENSRSMLDFRTSLENFIEEHTQRIERAKEWLKLAEEDVAQYLNKK